MRKSTSVAVTRTNYNIHAVEKVLDLLNAICEDGGEIRLTELSDRLGLSKPNVFRLLATLENRGLVVRGDDSRKYRLGLSAYEMGQKLLSGMALMRKSRPIMERLARDSGEAVYMTVPCDNELLFLEMVDSAQQVKVTPLVGKRFPLSASSLGNLLTASTPQAAKTGHKHSAVAPKASPLQILQVAEDTDTIGDGVTALGIPIVNAQERVIAILTIVGPSFRIFVEQRKNELTQLLADAGMSISTSLGFIYPAYRTTFTH